MRRCQDGQLGLRSCGDDGAPPDIKRLIFGIAKKKTISRLPIKFISDGSTRIWWVKKKILSIWSHRFVVPAPLNKRQRFDRKNFRKDVHSSSPYLYSKQLQTVHTKRASERSHVFLLKAHWNGRYLFVIREWTRVNTDYSGIGLLAEAARATVQRSKRNANNKVREAG